MYKIDWTIQRKVGEIIRPSKNSNLLYRIVGKYGPVMKLVRYYPHRKPQGREFGACLPFKTLEDLGYIKR